MRTHRIAGVAVMKLQPVETCIRRALVAGIHQIPGDVDSGHIGAQKG